MRRFVSPVGGEPPTGEPCAGEPHARFGGGRDREYNRFFLPLYKGWGGKLCKVRGEEDGELRMNDVYGLFFHT